MFSEASIQHICDRIQDQFPAFYKEQGAGFITFIRAYYEWLELEGNPLYNSRNRYAQFDIDTAEKQFLSHFREKYMWGLPPELLGNQRLLQKHILELYRSKGSEQAIRLLFQLLYGEDIDFYIPSYDIFKLSDNTWIQPHYLEVTHSPHFAELVGGMIEGTQSGAVAVVENYETRFVNGVLAHILFISNMRGEFEVGEKVTNGNIDATEAPIIRGSVTGLTVSGSSSNIDIGTVMTSTIGGKPVQVVVNSVYDGTGSLQFQVDLPGTYYSLDAEFTMYRGGPEDMLDNPVIDLDIDADEYGFPKNPPANSESIIGTSIFHPPHDTILPPGTPVTGAGASIKILSLKDTHIYQHYSDKIIDMVGVALDGEYPFPALPTSNSQTIIADSLRIDNITVGSIDQILVLDPGVNYSANVTFIPIDPYTSTSGILDANGVQVGTNGLITGVPIVGGSIVGGVTVHSSGYNNIDYSNLSFTADSNNSLTLSGIPVVGGMGWDVGYYDNTKSFLSDDKYLFDGHYYQDFSYVIRAARTLDKYIDILKAIAHPAGNAVYGDIRITADNQLVNRAIYVGVKIEGQRVESFDEGFTVGFK